MSTATASPILAAAGGSFLLEDRTPAEVFTPEDLTEEQRQNNDEIEILRAAGGKIWERWLAAVQEANAQRDEHGWTEETIAASSTWLAEKRHALLAELDQKDN